MAVTTVGTTHFVGTRIGLRTNKQVIHRAHGVIPGCKPPVLNGDSDRDVKWPEQGPRVSIGPGMRISMQGAAYIDHVRLDVEGSRHYRGVAEHQWGDPW